MGIDEKQILILLCAPYGKKVGGISRWTGHILNYYNSIDTDIHLHQFYPEKAGTFNSSSLFSRLYVGIRSFIPFLISLYKQLNKENYNVVHFTSSASVSLIKDIFSLKISKRKNI